MISLDTDCPVLIGLNRTDQHRGNQGSQLVRTMCLVHANLPIARCSITMSCLRTWYCTGARITASLAVCACTTSTAFMRALESRLLVISGTDSLLMNECIHGQCSGLGPASTRCVPVVPTPPAACPGRGPWGCVGTARPSGQGQVRTR